MNTTDQLEYQIGLLPSKLGEALQLVPSWYHDAARSLTLDHRVARAYCVISSHKENKVPNKTSVIGVCLYQDIRGLRPPQSDSQLLSIAIHPNFQNQGIGKSLLQFSLNQEKQFAKTFELYFTEDIGDREKLIHFFKKFSFHFKAWGQRLQVTRNTAMRANVLKDLRKPKSLKLVPWKEITTQQKLIIKNSLQHKWDVPHYLSPFRRIQSIHYGTSFGLFLRGRFIGWMITHKLNRSTIEYTNLFVDPRYQGRGYGLVALWNSLVKQFQSDDIFCDQATFIVPHQQSIMTELVREKFSNWVDECVPLLIGHRSPHASPNI